MSPPRFGGNRILGEAWQFIALARNEVYRRGLDGLEADARHVARGPERRAKAEAVAAAVTSCLREVEQDPCTGPLPQSWVALGQTLAALGPVSAAPCWQCDALGHWLGRVGRPYGVLLHDIARTRYLVSQRREAFLGAAHELEKCQGPSADVVNAIRQLDRAGWALDADRLTTVGIEAHAGYGWVVEAGKCRGCNSR